MNDERERVPQPPSITIVGAWARRGKPGYRETRGPSRHRLELVRKWPRGRAIFLLVFCTAWFGFLGVVYASMFASGASTMVKLFPLFHVAAGVGALYAALSELLNRTRIVIEGRALTVRHGPLPWPGNRDVDVHRVRQLFVHRRKANDGMPIDYAVCAHVDGLAIDLVRGLASHDEARFIEQVIEEHLAIADDPTANVLE